MSILSRVPNLLWWLVCVGVALVSWRFLIGGVAVTMPAMLPQFENRALILYAHIGLAPVALLILPFQFSSRFRTARSRLHRLMGRSYGLAVLLSGMAGLVLAVRTETGLAPWTGLGFASLAVLWLATTAQAVRLAMARRIEAHRRWMTRSAALTVAAVTLRIELPLMVFGFGLDFGVAYTIVAWLCWVPNLLIAELWLARRRPLPAP